jgi:predicted phosphodiesterase
MGKATQEERGEYYQKRARHYLNEGFDRREAHSKANQDCKEKFDVNPKAIRNSTKPYRGGKQNREAYPDKGETEPDEINENDSSTNDDPTETIRQQWTKDGDYHFDENTGEYLVYLDAANDMVSIPKEKMEQIWEWYSNWTGKTDTINQICQKIGFPRTWFNELRRTMGLTHDREPFTPEEMVEKETDQLVDDLLQKRRRELAQEWENEKLKQIKAEAEDYRRIRQGQIEPLKTALSQLDLTTNDTDYEIKTRTEGAENEDYCALVGIADCHIGYSDFDEDEWSVRDSGDRVIEAYKKVLERTLNNGTPERIILAFLGDFFHVDRESLSTSYGTQLEAEGLVEDILQEGYRVAHTLVEMAKEVAEVSIRVVEGNHDRVTSKGMAIHLDKVFDDCNTDLDFRERQYVTYEDNLICLWHGDTIRDRNIPNVMADEASDLWGETDNRYVAYGHIHPERINDEHRGVTLVRLAGPSGRDEYDYSHGYDPANALTCLRLHPSEGKIGIDYAS